MALLILLPFFFYSDKGSSRNPFSAFIDSHLPLAENNLYTQVTYSGTLQLPLKTELLKGRTVSHFC